jgi:alpha-glucosidase (family GH31 glycosyl hydrolase)
MIGNDLLVAPVLAARQTQRLVYLPSGVWYDYWTNKRYDGGKMIKIEAPLETVPIFVRGGAIIPKAPAMNHVNEKPRDPISFEIYPDDQGKAATSLYEDDGASPAYKTGAFRRTHISVTRTGRTYSISISAPEGTFTTPPRKFNLVIKPSGSQQTVVDNSQSKTVLIR